MSNRFLFGGAVSAIALVCAVEAHAQVTSSSVRGTVVGTDGIAVSGAEVTVTHVPSGTTKTTTTSAGGLYVENGLRVGGPFQITVSAAGYEPQTVENIFLQPGPAEQININLPALVAGDAIRVVGQALDRIDINNGVGSTYGLEQILNQPFCKSRFH